MKNLAKAFVITALLAAPATAMLASQPAEAQVYVAPGYACNPYYGCPGYAYGYPGYYGPGIALGFGWGHGYYGHAGWGRGGWYHRH